MNKKDILQSLARKYLRKLIPTADKLGIRSDIERILDDNNSGRCIATKEEVDRLSRAFNDSNIKLHDIPEALDKSYRYIDEHNIVKSIRKFKDKGRYSKVDVELLKEKLK